MKRHNQTTDVTVGNVKVRIYSRQRPTATGGTRTIYEVCDYSTGVRRMRGFSNPTEAKDEATRIARLMSTGDVHAATVSGKDMASYGRAVELLRPTGQSIEYASATYAQAYEILGGDRLIEASKYFVAHNPDNLPRKTVAEVASELIELRQGRNFSARYVGDLRARLHRFADAFHVQIASVTSADVGKWLDGMKVAPQTIKNYRTVTHTLFEFAERRGYIAKGSNPVAETEQPKIKGGTVEIYTPNELSKLLNSASPEFLPSLAIGAFAGCRTAEIQRLTWIDVDLNGGFITVSVDNSKTGSRRIIPIQPCLASWLNTYDHKTGPVWLGTAETYNDAQHATATASGVVWKANALRHSYASYRLASTQNAAQVSLELGNSPQVIFRHYRELVKPVDAAKWFAIVPKTGLGCGNIIA